MLLSEIVTWSVKIARFMEVWSPLPIRVEVVDERYHSRSVPKVKPSALLPTLVVPLGALGIPEI